MVLVPAGLLSQTQSLVPSDRIPDEVAYTALFMVVREGPKGHWDWETRNKWLTERGFDEREATEIALAATRFSKASAQLEIELAEVNRRHSGNLLSADAKRERDQVRNRISAALLAERTKLDRDLGPAGRAKLTAFVASMKKDIKMNATGH